MCKIKRIEQKNYSIIKIYQMNNRTAKMKQTAIVGIINRIRILIKIAILRNLMIKTQIAHLNAKILKTIMQTINQLVNMRNLLIPSLRMIILV